MTTPTVIWDRLQPFVEARMKEFGIPGAAVGVLFGDETWTAGFGITSVDHPLPVTAETRFQIGSITKTFTGTIIMRLAEEGRLALDDPIRTVLPEFRVADEAASKQATIRNLLTHTGGWAGDLFADTGSGSDALALYVEQMSDLEQVAPVGAAMSYNNAGFAVAGRIIEIVTGKPYAAVLQEMVLAPLGLEACTLDAGETMLKRFAVGHRVSPDGAEIAGPWPLPKYVAPMGGLICPVGDLLTYAEFHLGDGIAKTGERLLSPETLATMHRPAATVWGKESWGLPFAVDDSTGLRVVNHGGGTVGQIALLSFVPAHNFALAILTNADRGGLLTRAVTQWALQEYLGVSTEQPKPISAPESDLVAFVGRYVRPFQEIEIGLLGGRLISQTTFKQGFPTQDSPVPPPPPPSALSLVATDRLMVFDGPNRGGTLDVVRREDGTIGWLRSGLRLHRRVGKM